MRYILQNPRLAAGYHNSGGKKAKHGDNFAIGDRVEVAGCGQRGYAELTDLENYSGNLRVSDTAPVTYALRYFRSDMCTSHYCILLLPNRSSSAMASLSAFLKTA